ncbi:MAG: hypothetical protein IKQ62_00290 [Bacteroidaceae bacterium]|nr:hypothetical protein [Bacteroidaceae bacterium]
MRFHIYHERTPVSTAIAHLHPPPSYTRIHRHLTPVSTSPCHPYQPQAVTRINLVPSLFITVNETTDRSVR